MVTSEMANGIWGINYQNGLEKFPVSRKVEAAQGNPGGVSALWVSEHPLWRTRYYQSNIMLLFIRQIIRKYY